MEKDIVIQTLSNGRMMIEFTPSQINQAVNVDGDLITIKTDGIDGVTCVGYKQAHCIDKKHVDLIDVSKHPFDAELNIKEQQIKSPYCVKYTSNDKWEYTGGCLIVFAVNEDKAKGKAIDLIKENGIWGDGYEIHSIKPIEDSDIFIQGPAIE